MFLKFSFWNTNTVFKSSENQAQVLLKIVNENKASLKISRGVNIFSLEGNTLTF